MISVNEKKERARFPMEGWIRKEIYALIINEIVDGVENYSLGMEIISNVMDMVQGEHSVVMAGKR